MVNLITKNSYYNYEDLVIESVRTGRMTVKSGEGVIVKGQVFDFDATSLKLVKHVAGNDIVAVALEGIDATSSDANVQVLIEGTVNSFKLVGIDYLVSTNEIRTPSAPVASLVEGGSLTANTELIFKVVAKNSNGKTLPSAIATATPVNATSGYFESANSYANIGTINAVLGNCSVINKNLILNINGTTYSIVFNADYSGAGAFADFNEFKAVLDTVSSTTTIGAGTKIKVASDTTGSASIATIVSDTTGLFGTPTVVAGANAKKTVKVDFEETIGAESYIVYKSNDAGVNYSYKEVSANDVANGYFLDNGAVVYTAGAPITVSDIAGLKSMYSQGLYAEEIISGYVR